MCTTNLKNPHEDLDVSTDVRTEVDGVSVYYEPTVISRYYGFSPQLYRRINQEIQMADLVFVHFHYQFANWAGAYLARKQNKPYVIFAHGSFNKWGIQRRSSTLKRAYLSTVERKNIENAIFIAFNAEEEKQLSLFSERGEVIPSGVSPGDFTNCPERGWWRERHPQLKDRICFLYLGRLNPQQKGLDLLIPAFAKLARQNENVHLILAGPDERGGKAEVQSMVRSLAIDDRVTLTGMVSGVEKLGILRDADVYTLTSPSEGTSIALLEAMYMGLPPIVTNRVGLSETIARNNCGLVIEQDVESVSSAMETLLTSKLRSRLGHNSQQLIANNFTWDVITECLLNKIKDTIAEQS